MYNSFKGLSGLWLTDRKQRIASSEHGDIICMLILLSVKNKNFGHVYFICPSFPHSSGARLFMEFLILVILFATHVTLIYEPLLFYFIHAEAKNLLIYYLT